MPSAAQVKSVKMPVNEDNAAAGAIACPLQVVEKKMRNLEKRKKKLDVVQARRAKGERLDADQEDALKHYAEVTNSLELLRDTHKQMQGVMLESEKLAKKQAKRVQMERQQEELERFKELLLIDDVLEQLGDEKLRKNLETATSDEVEVTENVFSDVDHLYKLLKPERATLGDEFETALEHAAEHYQMLLDGKESTVPDTSTSYAKIKQLLKYVSQSKQLAERLTASEDSDEVEDGNKEPLHSDIADLEGSESEPEAFEHVTLGEVPPADSEEVQAALPSEPEPELPETTLSSAPVATEVFNDQAQQRDFNDIVSAVQGQFTFLQDSVIEQPAAAQLAGPALHQQLTTDAHLRFSASPASGTPQSDSATATFEATQPSAQDQIPFDAPVVAPTQPPLSEESIDSSYSGVAAFSSEYSNFPGYSNQPSFEQSAAMPGLSSSLGQFGQSNVAPTDLAEEGKFPNVSAQSFEPNPPGFGQMESEPDFQQVNYGRSGARQARGGRQPQPNFGAPRSQSGGQRTGYPPRDRRPASNYTASNNRPRNTGYAGQSNSSAYSGGGRSNDFSVNGSNYGSGQGSGQFRRGGGTSRGGSRSSMGGNTRPGPNSSQRPARGGYGQPNSGSKY